MNRRNAWHSDTSRFRLTEPATLAFVRVSSSLFASAAGRGAVSSRGAAPAYFSGRLVPPRALQLDRTS